MTTETDDMVPVEAVELVAQLVQANADMLNHTTNALLASTERQARYFAGALLRLVDTLEDLPDTVMTVAVMRALDSVYVPVASARRTLGSEPLHGDRDAHEYRSARIDGPA